MSDMLDKIKDLLDAENPPDPETPIDGKPPLEQALERALFSFGEIQLYGEYGRAAECAREATEALEVLHALKQKFDEQNAIMEALTNPPVVEEEEDD